VKDSCEACGEKGCTHSPFVSCEISSAFASPCCAILESISEGVLTVNRDRKVTSFNHAAEVITGFRADDAIGQNCYDILRTSVCEGRCPTEATLSSGEAVNNIQTEIISKSGVRKPISINTVPLRDNKGGHRTFVWEAPIYCGHGLMT